MNEIEQYYYKQYKDAHIQHDYRDLMLKFEDAWYEGDINDTLLVVREQSGAHHYNRIVTFYLSEFDISLHHLDAVTRELASNVYKEMYTMNKDTPLTKEDVTQLNDMFDL